MDAESGKYLFEVEAKATGQPEPEITFNRYDDPEQVGENRITLLLKGGESFTLVVLAENSAGKATDELKLETEDTGDGSDKPGPGSGPGPVSPPAAENRPPVISKIVLSKDLLQTGGTYTVTAEVSLSLIHI